MKKLLLSAGVTLVSFSCIFAQISSTDCMEDIRKIYSRLDHEALLAGSTQTRFSFKHSYIMRFDEEGKTVTHDESLILGPKLVYYDTPEFTECSDGNEAFNYRKYQFLIYRTKSTLDKTAAIIPGMDKGIFAFCLVRECRFVPAPGEDTLRHKRAYMTVSEEGQKKYPVKDLEFVWNPLTMEPLIAGVTFTDKSLWKWGRWDFHSIAKVDQPIPGDVKGNLLDANGQVQVQFKGSEVLDYR
jgi:hypothetical protein